MTSVFQYLSKTILYIYTEIFYLEYEKIKLFHPRFGNFCMYLMVKRFQFLKRFQSIFFVVPFPDPRNLKKSGSGSVLRPSFLGTAEF
jgi:hypothetical protein